MTHVLTRRRVLRGLGALGAASLLPFEARAQTDGFGAAVWIRIPSIEVDSHVSEVEIVNGYYDVPWFDIGHHVGSANPGDLGNSIFNGHVVTINAGDVFSRLHELRLGDAVYAYTADYRLDWVITDLYTVGQDDNVFLDQTEQPRITLYTCTGQFNPIERNYAERLVAVGQLVSTGPRI